MYLYVVEARLQLVQVVSLYPKCRGKTKGKTYGRLPLVNRHMERGKLEESTTRSFECRLYAYMLRAAYSDKVHMITCPKTIAKNHMKNHSLNSVASRERINRCVQVQKESRIKNKNTVHCTDSTESVRSV